MKHKTEILLSFVRAFYARTLCLRVFCIIGIATTVMTFVPSPAGAAYVYCKLSSGYSQQADDYTYADPSGYCRKCSDASDGNYGNRTSCGQGVFECRTGSPWWDSSAKRYYCYPCSEGYVYFKDSGCKEASKIDYFNTSCWGYYQPKDWSDSKNKIEACKCISGFKFSYSSSSVSCTCPSEGYYWARANGKLAWCWQCPSSQSSGNPVCQSGDNGGITACNDNSYYRVQYKDYYDPKYGKYECRPCPGASNATSYTFYSPYSLSSTTWSSNTGADRCKMQGFVKTSSYSYSCEIKFNYAPSDGCKGRTIATDNNHPAEYDVIFSTETLPDASHMVDSNTSNDNRCVWNRSVDYGGSNVSNGYYVTGQSCERCSAGTFGGNGKCHQCPYAVALDSDPFNWQQGTTSSSGSAQNACFLDKGSSSTIAGSHTKGKCNIQSETYKGTPTYRACVSNCRMNRLDAYYAATSWACYNGWWTSYNNVSALGVGPSNGCFGMSGQDLAVCQERCPSGLGTTFNLGQDPDCFEMTYEYDGSSDLERTWNDFRNIAHALQLQEVGGCSVSFETVYMD